MNALALFTRHSWNIALLTKYSFILAFVAIFTPHELSAAPINSGLVLWLKADSLSLNNNDPVSAWADSDGNGGGATQGTAGSQPRYKAIGANGMPAVNFDGGNEFLTDTDANLNITGSSLSLFIAFQFTNTGAGSPAGEQALLSTYGGVPSGYLLYDTTTNEYQFIAGGIPDDGNSATAVATPTILAGIKGGANPNGAVSLYQNGASVFSIGNNTAITSSPNPLQIGRSSGVNQQLNGDISEVLIYNSTLNTAQRVITENYLSSKYQTVALASNDKYGGDTSGNGNHDFDVFGIGQEAAGSLAGASPAGDVTSGAGDAIALLELNTSLVDGEYLLAGRAATAHGISTSDLPGGAWSRWSRDYFLDFTGTLDATLTFDLSAQSLPTGHGYTLLFRAGTSGQYTNLALTDNINGSLVSFDLVGFDNLDDGFYTIAAVPEPTSSVLVWSSFCGVICARRFRLMAR